MEPQINYGGSTFPNQSPSFTPKIYGRSRFGNKGCFGVIGLLIIILAIVLIGIFFAYPALTPNSIHGDFLDMTIVPQKDGTQKLWILTDGSFKFIQTTKSPGSYSSGVKCYFCKTWTYVYDPAGEKIEKKIKTEINDVLTHIDIFYRKGKIWEVADGYHENEPRVDIYDPETAEKVTDTKAFVAKFPVLSGGLAGLRYDEKDQTITFKTKDGKEQVIYSIDEDKIYDNQGDYSKSQRSSEVTETITVLSPEASSSKRYKLYSVTGPKGKVEDKRSSLQHFVLDESSKRSMEGLDIQPAGGKAYLEGIVYYNDDDCAVVIYLDQTGRKSNRFMTCIDLKTGKEKWTVGPDDLFKNMRIDQDKNSFSDLFFTKDKIKVRRSGNLVVVEMKDEGLIGFDFQTGKQLWKMNI